MDQDTRTYLDRKFKAVDEQFTSVDKRFDAVDERLDGVDEVLDGVGKRLDGVDKRLDSVDKRLGSVDKRLETVDGKLDTVDKRFDAVDEKFVEMRRHFDVVAEDSNSRIQLISEGHDVVRREMQEFREEVQTGFRELQSLTKIFLCGVGSQDSNARGRPFSLES